MQIEHNKSGYYYISTKNNKNLKISKYGRMRLRFLKEYRRGEYSILIVENKLQKHLMDIDKIANERLHLLMKQFAEKENITEELKINDQMEWVKRMNNIKNCAEEIILKELIYV